MSVHYHDFQRGRPAAEAGEALSPDQKAMNLRKGVWGALMELKPLMGRESLADYLRSVASAIEKSGG